MRRSGLLVLLLLIPGVILSVLALAFTAREHREGLRALERQLLQEGEALQRRVRFATEQGVEEARLRLATAAAGSALDFASEPVVFVDESGCFYRPLPAAVPPPPSAEDEKLYELARIGGESYELAHGDGLRAVDAYGFYLPRIESPVLRDRLRFRAARAARRAGERELAASIFGALFTERTVATEAGLPLELLAGLEQLRLEAKSTTPAAPSLRSRVESRLRERQWDLSTDILELLVGAIATKSPEIRANLELRRGLEEAIARRSSAESSIWIDGAFLFVRGDTGPAGRIPIARVPLRLPPLEAGEYEAALLRAPPAMAGDDPAARVFPIAVEGADSLAWIEVHDGRHGERVRALARDRWIQSALVVLLILLIAGATLTLLLALGRERRLAELRVRLLANVSHELKTPVTSIRIFSEMLANEELDEKRTRRFGHMILSESQRLGQLIQDLLDTTTARRIHRPPVRARVDLRELLLRLGEAFAYRAEEEGVELAMELPPASRGGGLEIETDAAVVERIVLNLLDNALKYRRDDGPRIELALLPNPRGVQIRVQDNGLGIDPRDQAHVFEEFYRARFESYGVQGSGLGLAIARRLAESLGGRLLLESRPGQGSTFTLELPHAPREQTDRGTETEQRRTG